VADLQYIRAEIGTPLREPRQTAGRSEITMEKRQGAVLDQTGFE